MTLETSIRCNRCNKLINPDDNPVHLIVQPSEDYILRVPNNSIDLCFACEKDMVLFMTGEVFHKFMEKAK